MELLLFLLFVLFSIFSALTERRKRRRALEHSRELHEGRQAAQSREALEEREEPEAEEWPFPAHEGDPFALEPPRRRRAVELRAEGEDEAAQQGQLAAEQRRLEAQALEAEQRARELEEQARALRPRRVDELIQERLKQHPQAGARKRRQGWVLTPQSARQAIVLAEILGPPRAEREENF